MLLGFKSYGMEQFSTETTIIIRSGQLTHSKELSVEGGLVEPHTQWFASLIFFKKQFCLISKIN